MKNVTGSAVKNSSRERSARLTVSRKGCVKKSLCVSVRVLALALIALLVTGYSPKVVLADDGWVEAGDFLVKGDSSGYEVKTVTYGASGSGHQSAESLVFTKSGHYEIKNKAEKTTTTMPIDIGDPNGDPNIDVWLTMRGVKIEDSIIPLNVESSNSGTNGATLHLILGDNSENTLKAKLGSYSPGLRCGEGATLYIDDEILNYEYTSGGYNYDKHISYGVKGNKHHDIPGNDGVEDSEYGRIPQGTSYYRADKGDAWVAGTEPGDNRLSLLDSDQRGSLTVVGGYYAAGIGGGSRETNGVIVIDGGKISATASDGNEKTESAAAGIGGGAHANGGVFIINGGELEAQAAWHGAGIGAGWANVSPSTSNNFLRAKTDNNNTTYSNNSYQTKSGDIYINGGNTESKGSGHGNAFGQACCGNAKDCEFVITGGTLLPSSVSGRYDIGGEGAAVYVLGGSVRVLDNKFQAEINGSDTSETAYYKYPATGTDNPTVMMTTIELGGYGDNAKNAKIQILDMTINGVPTNYGLPHSTDNEGKLYLWLPSTAQGEVSVTLKVIGANDGKVINTSTFFIKDVEKITDAKDRVLKQYYEFLIPDEHNDNVGVEVPLREGSSFKTTYPKGLSSYYDTNKHYDGLAYASGPDKVTNTDSGSADSNLGRIITSEIKPKVDNPSKSETALQDKDYFAIDNHQSLLLQYQETDQSGTSFGGGIGEGSPIYAGYNQLLITSQQYTGVNQYADFSKSFWGHRSYFNSIYISPANSMTDVSAVSLVTDVDGNVSEVPVTVNSDGEVVVGEESVDAAHPVRFTAKVRPWRTYADGTTEYVDEQKELLKYNGEVLTQTMVEEAASQNNAYYKNAAGNVQLLGNAASIPSGYSKVEKGSEALTVQAPTGKVYFYAVPYDTTDATLNYDNAVLLGQEALVREAIGADEDGNGGVAAKDMQNYPYSEASITIDFSDPSSLIAFNGEIPNKFKLVARYVGFDDPLRDSKVRINYNGSNGWFPHTGDIKFEGNTVNPHDKSLELQVLRDEELLQAPEYATSVSTATGDVANLTGQLLHTDDEGKTQVIMGGTYTYTLVDEHGVEIESSEYIDLSTNDETGTVTPKSRGVAYVRVTRMGDGAYEATSKIVKIYVTEGKLYAHSELDISESEAQAKGPKVYGKAYAGMPIVDTLSKTYDGATNEDTAQAWAMHLATAATERALQDTDPTKHVTYRLVGWRLGSETSAGDGPILTANDILSGTYKDEIPVTHVWAVYASHVIGTGTDPDGEDDGKGPWIRKSVTVDDEDSVLVNTNTGQRRLPIVLRPLHVKLTVNDAMKNFKDIDSETLPVAALDDNNQPIYSDTILDEQPSDVDAQVIGYNNEKVNKYKTNSSGDQTTWQEVTYKRVAKVVNGVPVYSTQPLETAPDNTYEKITTADGTEVDRYKSESADGELQWFEITYQQLAKTDNNGDPQYSDTAMATQPSDDELQVKIPVYRGTDVNKYKKVTTYYEVEYEKYAVVDSSGNVEYSSTALDGTPTDHSAKVKAINGSDVNQYKYDNESYYEVVYVTRAKTENGEAVYSMTALNEAPSNLSAIVSALGEATVPKYKTVETYYEIEYMKYAKTDNDSPVYTATPLESKPANTSAKVLTPNGTEIDRYKKETVNNNDEWHEVEYSNEQVQVAVTTGESGQEVGVYSSTAVTESLTDEQKAEKVTTAKGGKVDKYESKSTTGHQQWFEVETEIATATIVTAQKEVSVDWDTITFVDKLPEGTALTPLDNASSVVLKTSKGNTITPSSSEYNSNTRELTVKVAKSELESLETTDDVFLEFDIVTTYETIGSILYNDAKISYDKGNAVQVAGTTNRVEIGPIQDTGNLTLNKTATNSAAAARDPKRTHVGDTIHYEITPSNSKTYTWKDVLFYDQLPDTLDIDLDTLKLADANGVEYTIANGKLANNVYDESTRTICLLIGDVPAAKTNSVSLSFDAKVNIKATAGSIRNVAYAHGGIYGNDGHEGTIGTKPTLPTGGIGALSGRVQSNVAVPYDVDGGPNGGENTSNNMLLARERGTNKTIRRYYAENLQVGTPILSVLRQSADNVTTSTNESVRSAQGWADTLTSLNTGGYKRDGRELVGWTFDPEQNILISVNDLVPQGITSVYPVYATKSIPGGSDDDPGSGPGGTSPYIRKSVTDLNRNIAYDSQQQYKTNGVSGVGSWTGANVLDRVRYTITVGNISQLIDSSTAQGTDDWNMVEFADMLPSHHRLIDKTAITVTCNDATVSDYSTNVGTDGLIRVFIGRTADIAQYGFTVSYEAEILPSILKEEEGERFTQNDASVILKNAAKTTVGGGSSNVVTIGPITDPGEQTITKTFKNLASPDSDNTKVGDEIEYTIVVNNTKHYPWQGVVLYDKLPAAVDVDPASIKLLDANQREYNNDAVDENKNWYVASEHAIRVTAGTLPGSSEIGGGGTVTLTYRGKVNEHALARTYTEDFPGQSGETYIGSAYLTNEALAHGGIDDNSDVHRVDGNPVEPGNVWSGNPDTLNNPSRDDATLPKKDDVAANDGDYLLAIDRNHPNIVGRFHTDAERYANAGAMAKEDLVGASINALAGTEVPRQPGVKALRNLSDTALEWANIPSENGGPQPTGSTFVGWTDNPIVWWNNNGTDRIIADYETMPEGVKRIYPVYAYERVSVNKTMTLDDAKGNYKVFGNEKLPVLGSIIHSTITARIVNHDEENHPVNKFVFDDKIPAHTSVVGVWRIDGDQKTELTLAADADEIKENEYILTDDGHLIYKQTISVNIGDVELPTILVDLQVNVDGDALDKVLQNVAVVSVAKDDDLVGTGQGDDVLGPVADPGTRDIVKVAYNKSAHDTQISGVGGRRYTRIGDVVHYTLTAHNYMWYDQWNNVVIYDRIPESLTIDTSSIRLRDWEGKTIYTVPSSAYNTLTRELCVFAGNVPPAGKDGSFKNNKVQVEFDATVNDHMAKDQKQTTDTLWNRAQALDGVDTGICAAGTNTPGVRAQLQTDRNIDYYKNNYSDSYDYVESAAVLPFIGEDEGVEGEEAILLVCWREESPSQIDSIDRDRNNSDERVGVPHMGYLMPNCILYEPIIDRLRVVASVMGYESLREYYPGAARQTGSEAAVGVLAEGEDSADAGIDISSEAIANMSGDAWGQTLKNPGPMPVDDDTYFYVWRGWTDNPRTSWNPYGDDRILGPNDLIQPGINRVYPVYARVKMPKDERTDDPYDPPLLKMEKGLVTRVEKSTIYQELEYKVAAHNLATNTDSWANVTFMDKFPSYAKLVPGSVALKIVDYTGVTEQQRKDGADGKIIREYPLTQSSDNRLGTFESGKYNYDEDRGMISYRILAEWLPSNPINVGPNQSCELRFKIYVTRDVFETVEDTTNPVNDSTVTWYPPVPDDPTSEDWLPLWTVTDTAPIPIPSESTGTRGTTKHAENLTRTEGGARIGDRIRYTITASNTKSYNWENVRILDVLPEELTIDTSTIRIIGIDGTEHVVDPQAYVEETRRLCVAAGTIGQDEEVTLVFEALINSNAANEEANVGNTAWSGGDDPWECVDPPSIGDPVDWPDEWELDPDSDGTGTGVGTGIGTGVCYPPETDEGPIPYPEPEPEIGERLRNVTNPDDPNIMTKTVAVEEGEHYKEVLRYTVTLHNPMPGPDWEDMSIFDFLPEELVYLNGTLKLTKPDGTVVDLPDSYFDPVEHVFEVPIGNIAYDETYVMEYRVGVPDDMPEEKPIVNTASTKVPEEKEEPKEQVKQIVKVARKTAKRIVLARTGDNLVAPVALVVAAAGAIAVGVAVRRRRTE